MGYTASKRGESQRTRESHGMEQGPLTQMVEVTPVAVATAELF